MKLIICLASFVGGLATCYLLLSLGAVPKRNGIPNSPNDASQTVSIYLSFVGVMMTAVTVVLTALAIGIGVIAAFTFSGLKTEARSAAQTTAREISEYTAREVTSEALSEVRIKGMVDAFLAVNIRDRHQVAEWGSEPDEDEDR